MKPFLLFKVLSFFYVFTHVEKENMNTIKGYTYNKNITGDLNYILYSFHTP